MKQIELNGIKVDLLKELGDRYGNDGATVSINNELVNLSNITGVKLFYIYKEDFEIAITNFPDTNEKVFYVSLYDESDDIFDISVNLYSMEDVDNLINILRLTYKGYLMSKV